MLNVYQVIFYNYIHSKIVAINGKIYAYDDGYDPLLEN